jgi:xylono-1,5-lactonase
MSEKVRTNPPDWPKFGPGEGYPDGMTTDAAGRLWISCHDPVTVEELARVEMPTVHITNVAFGGADFRTLFITSAQSELSAEQLAAQPLAG